MQYFETNFHSFSASITESPARPFLLLAYQIRAPKRQFIPEIRADFGGLLPWLGSILKRPDPDGRRLGQVDNFNGFYQERTDPRFFQRPNEVPD